MRGKTDEKINQKQGKKQMCRLPIGESANKIKKNKKSKCVGYLLPMRQLDTRSTRHSPEMAALIQKQKYKKGVWGYRVRGKNLEIRKSKPNSKS
jgi:hypothetical protein